VEEAPSAKLVERVAPLDRRIALLLGRELHVHERVYALGEGRLVLPLVRAYDHPAALLGVHRADEGPQVRGLVPSVEGEARRQVPEQRLGLDGERAVEVGHRRGLGLSAHRYDITILAVFQRPFDVHRGHEVGRRAGLHGCAAQARDEVGGLAVGVGDGDVLALGPVLELVRASRRLVAGIVLKGDGFPIEADQNADLGLRPEDQPAVFGFGDARKNDAPRAATRPSTSSVKPKTSAFLMSLLLAGGAVPLVATPLSSVTARGAGRKPEVKAVLCGRALPPRG
jgi:hypothetical protein